VVFIDGLYKAGSDFARVFIQDPFLIATVYTMSLMGILGVHEMGHMIANRWHGVRSSWPYFIPIIPGVFLVPTLGAAIVARSNMTNRNVLFDVGISGPIAGLIVTVVVAFYGSQISVLIPAFQVDDLEGQLMRLPTSFLMAAIQDLTVSDDDDAGDGSVLIMSPVLIAAWVGFFVTFLNLMPAAQLDGGHIVRSALGIRWHRTLTYSSIAFMIGLGFATQIFGITLMAIFVLLIARRAPESTPLDDVSPLSKKRKALFWVAIAITILCAPLPQEVFNPLF
jgi:membrane-associated protease RseP (regulator of RpoE activity)